MKLIKFYGDNCSGCKVMEHVRNEAKLKFPDLTRTEIKIEDEPALTEARKIRSVPTIIIEGPDGELARKSGVIAPMEFQEWIQSFITNE